MTALRTSSLVKTYTLEEFWKLDAPGEGSRLELIAGVLFKTPMRCVAAILILA